MTGERTTIFGRTTCISIRITSTLFRLPTIGTLLKLPNRSRFQSQPDEPMLGGLSTIRFQERERIFCHERALLCWTPMETFWKTPTICSGASNPITMIVASITIKLHREPIMCASTGPDLKNTRYRLRAILICRQLISMVPSLETLSRHYLLASPQLWKTNSGATTQIFPAGVATRFRSRLPGGQSFTSTQMERFNRQRGMGFMLRRLIHRKDFKKVSTSFELTLTTWPAKS